MQFNLINYPKFNESTTRKQNKNNTKTIHIFNDLMEFLTQPLIMKNFKLVMLN